MKAYTVKGMTCQGCVKSVKSALERVGVEAVVDLDTHQARVADDVDADVVRKAVEGAGFDFEGLVGDPA